MNSLIQQFSDLKQVYSFLINDAVFGTTTRINQETLKSPIFDALYNKEVFSLEPDFTISPSPIYPGVTVSIASIGGTSNFDVIDIGQPDSTQVTFPTRVYNSNTVSFKYTQSGVYPVSLLQVDIDSKLSAGAITKYIEVLERTDNPAFSDVYVSKRDGGFSKYSIESGDLIWNKLTSDVAFMEQFDVNKEGNIAYFTDTTIFIIDPNGNILEQGPKIGDTSTISFDSEGNFWIVNQDFADIENKIIKLSPQVEEIISVPLDEFPMMVFTDFEDNILVAIQGQGIIEDSYSVAKFDKNGNLQWGYYTGAVGYSVSCDRDNNVYVSGEPNSEDDIIFKLDKDGNLLNSISSLSDAYYSAICNDDEGNLYAVVMGGDEEVNKYSPEGTLLWSVTNRWSEASYIYTNRIQVDSVSEHLIISNDANAGDADVFIINTADGSLVRTIKFDSTCRSIAVSPNPKFK